MPTFICSDPLYEYTYNGRTWRFEVGYSSAWPVRKDGSLYNRAGKRFWEAFEAWLKEPDREKFLVE